MNGVGFSDFYDATAARQIAVGGAGGLGVILTEINYIKLQIDTEAPTGALSVTITAATTMTNGTVYYEAWADPVMYQDDPHKLARAKMDAVVGYFQMLGYAVKRSQNGVLDLIQWTISW